MDFGFSRVFGVGNSAKVYNNNRRSSKEDEDKNKKKKDKKEVQSKLSKEIKPSEDTIDKPLEKKFRLDDYV